MPLVKPDKTRVELVTRAHCAVPSKAYKMWADASPKLQKPDAKQKNEIQIYGLILPHEEAVFARDCFGDETVMSGKMFHDQMNEIDGDVVLRINCDGGCVFEASTMLSAIRERQEAGHKVNATVDGIAASAASLLTAAADRVVMSELGFIMIHEANGGMVGSAQDLRNGAKLIDDMNAAAAKMYANRSGIEQDEIRQMMADETYMAADEAVEKGFAAEIQAAPDPEPQVDAKATMKRRNARLAAVLQAVTA